MLIDCSAFVSPDSASLTELLLPKDSGLYMEDLLRTLIPQIDPLATISIIPVEDLFSLARLEGDHEEGMVDKLSKAGRIGDPEALEDAAASPRTEANGSHLDRRSDQLSSTVQMSNLCLQFAQSCPKLFWLFEEVKNGIVKD